MLSGVTWQARLGALPGSPYPVASHLRSIIPAPSRLRTLGLVPAPADAQGPQAGAEPRAKHQEPALSRNRI
jgi:hypothetical protein